MWGKQRERCLAGFVWANAWTLAQGMNLEFDEIAQLKPLKMEVFLLLSLKLNGAEKGYFEQLSFLLISTLFICGTDCQYLMILEGLL